MEDDYKKERNNENDQINIIPKQDSRTPFLEDDIPDFSEKSTDEKIQIFVDQILGGFQYIETSVQENLVHRKNLVTWLKYFRIFVDNDVAFENSYDSLIEFYKQLINNCIELNLDNKIVHSIVITFNRMIVKVHALITILIDIGLFDMCIKVLNLGVLRTSQDIYQCLTLICELSPEHFHFLQKLFSPAVIYDIIIHYNANDEETLQYAEYATMLTKYLYYFCLNCKNMSEDNLTYLGIIIQHAYRYEQTWQKIYVFKTIYLLLENDKIKINEIGPEYFNISFSNQFQNYALSNGLELCKLMNLMLEKGWDGKEFPYTDILYFIFTSKAKDSTYPIMETLAYALEKIPIEMKFSFVDNSMREYSKIILGCCSDIGNGQLNKSFGSMMRMGQILVNLYEDFPEKLMDFYPHSYQALMNLLQIENIQLQKKTLKLYIFMTQNILNLNILSLDNVRAYFEENDGAAIMDSMNEQEDEEIDVLLDHLHDLLYPE